MRVVFMGTPEFAVSSLKALISGGHQLVGVFTQPDRYRGRKEQVSFSPVKAAALEANIPVYQPVKIREPENLEILQELAPDVIVVAAFGQILPKCILDLPKLGCINVHASLLPKYRGAAPIQWCILNGEEKTGITIMQMAQGLDTGDILSQAECEISSEETGDSLHDKLAEMSGPLLLETLTKLERGQIQPIPQDDAKSCYAKMLDKVLGSLDFTQPAVVLERYVRGLNSWPSAYTSWKGMQLKIWKASVAAEDSQMEPGQVSRVSGKDFWIQTGSGQLIVEEVQLQGKKRMSTEAFLRGNEISTETRFGTAQ